MSPRSRLWRHGDFLRLWLGQTVSELGSQITLVALPLTAILTLHASAFAVALLSSFEFVPFLLFGLLAGVWVDRLPYRRVCIVADLGRAVTLGTVPLAYAFGVLSLPQLYVVGFAAGTLTVFFTCAYSAYLPTLIGSGDLIEANATLEASRSVSQTAGPGVGGGLVALISAPVAILADAASFVVSGAAIAAIRHRAGPRVIPEKRHLAVEVREGIGYVWSQPILRANLFSSGLANFSYGLVWAILIVFAVRVLGLHAGVIGAILAVGQAGGVLGAVLARRIAAKLGVGPAFIAAIACLGPATFVLAAATRSTAIPLLATGWGLWSFGASMTGVIGVGIRQALVPQRLQGRVVGATRSIIWGIAPIGSAVGGALAATTGLRSALLVGAVLASLAFVPLVLSPARRLRGLPPLASDPAVP